MGDPIIQLDHVFKTFQTRSGPVHALDDVSLDFERGDISAVIGQSGAGKSTLVRLINGLEQPTSGTVAVLGTDISRFTERSLRPLRADIGMIFQQFNLFNSRTVYDNIAYPLKLARWSKADERARVTELLSFVGLTERAWTHPDQLSGGQKQRVGIARALATRPTILLADESTSALDPETTSDVLGLLQRINAELGVTVIVITHEMEVVRSIADKVSVLEHGTLIETGPTREIFAHPGSGTTRRFLSTIIGQHPGPRSWPGCAPRIRTPPWSTCPASTPPSSGWPWPSWAASSGSPSGSSTAASSRSAAGPSGNYTVALTGEPDDVADAARRLAAVAGDSNAENSNTEREDA
jgi:D-methionine transport system ATP-binding protein